MKEDLDIFENNPDASIVKILVKLAKCGEHHPDGFKSLTNQIIEIDGLGFDGYPVSNMNVYKGEGFFAKGVELTKQFFKTVYVKRKVVMDDEDNVPTTLEINDLANCVALLKAGDVYNIQCQNEEYLVSFYVRKGSNVENKPKGARDLLDMTFVAHNVGVSREAGALLMKFSILQKIVALCTGLFPGKLTGVLLTAFADDVVLDAIDEINKAYKSIYYKGEQLSFRYGLTQILINNELMDKWRSNIPEIYPTILDFKEDGSDFTIVKKA